MDLASLARWPDVQNYLAGNEEGRLGSQLYYDKKMGWTWDGSLGGHVGIIRFGTQDPAWPEGWQLDVNGAALPRLDSTRSMVSTDFRIGFPLRTAKGRGNSSSAIIISVRTWAISTCCPIPT